MVALNWRNTRWQGAETRNKPFRHRLVLHVQRAMP